MQLRILFGSLFGAANMVEFSSTLRLFPDLVARTDIDLAHLKRVLHAHGARSGGTALRSSTGGAYTRRGAAQTAWICALFRRRRVRFRVTSSRPRHMVINFRRRKGMTDHLLESHDGGRTQERPPLKRHFLRPPPTPRPPARPNLNTASSVATERARARAIVRKWKPPKTRRDDVSREPRRREKTGTASLKRHASFALPHRCARPTQLQHGVVRGNQEGARARKRAEMGTTDDTAMT